jgi:carbon storage regulator
MLVLSRKVGERIFIGNNVTILIKQASTGRVTVAIDAPDDIPITRDDTKDFPLPNVLSQYCEKEVQRFSNSDIENARNGQSPDKRE